MSKIGFDDFAIPGTTKADIDKLRTVDLDDEIFAAENSRYDAWAQSKDLSAAAPARIVSRRLDDIGNGERFFDQHGDECKWSAGLDWMIWNGKFWQDNDTHEVERRAEITSRMILVEAMQSKASADRYGELVKWAGKSAAMPRVNAMLESAKNKPGMSIRASEFDKNYHLVSVKNGTLDLRSDALGEHRKEDLITKYIDIDYDRSATCPLWTEFLERIMPEKDTREFVQRAVGYSLTGLTVEHCFFLLYGTGANGKSTFLDTLRAIFSSYGGVIRAETLMFKTSNNAGAATPELASMRGLRFISASETDEGKQLSEGLMKEITGNRTIKARSLYKADFEFEPTFKIFLAVNHLPRIRGTDEGIWRRLRRIPFNVEIPTAEQDKTMLDKLWEERMGILTWIVDGYWMWQKDGLGLCAEVDQATRQYRKDSDPLKDFFEEYFEITGDPDDQISRPYMRETYDSFCKTNGDKPMSAKALTEKLRERGLTEGKSDGTRYWIGVKSTSGI